MGGRRDEAEVADERLVEDRVDRLPVVAAALRLAPDARALTHALSLLAASPPSHADSDSRLRENAEGEVDRAARGAEPACEAEIGRRFRQEPGVDIVEAEPANCSRRQRQTTCSSESIASSGGSIRTFAMSVKRRTSPEGVTPKEGHLGIVSDPGA